MRATGRAARVLILEDNSVSRFVIREVLERAGCVCAEAGNAAEAAEAIGAASFDLLVSDVSLGAENGFEVAQRLRGAEFPVLFISGYTLDQLIARGAVRRDHFDPDRTAFLRKPFLPAALMKEVDALLALRHPSEPRT